MSSEELERSVRLIAAHRAIEQKIYRMGYALEDGDFALVGELLQHSTLGADMIGRRVFTGRDEIRGQYERTFLCGSAATDWRLRRGSDYAVN